MWPNRCSSLIARNLIGLVEDPFGRPARVARGSWIAVYQRGGGRAVEEDQERACDGLNRADAGGSDQVVVEPLLPVAVPLSHLACGRRQLGQLTTNFLERTAAELLALNQAVCTSSIRRSRARGSRSGSSTSACTFARQAAAVTVEIGGDEIVLRGVVRVERGFGDAGLVDDPLDADRPDALPVEQPQAVARMRSATPGMAGVGRTGAWDVFGPSLDYTDWSV